MNKERNMSENEPVMHAGQKRTSTLMIISGTLLLALIALGIVFLQKNDSVEGDNASGRTALLATGYETVPSEARFTERSGKEVALGELRGNIWVASFIFTRCRGTCPAMTASMAELQDQLKTVGTARLVSFTVDPEYDTPEKLQEYAKEYGADGDRWLFLQGSDSAIQNLAKNTFHVGIAEGTSEEEPIIHSSRFFLVDSNGEIRGMYDGRSKQGQEQLLDAVRLLIEEEEDGHGV